MKKMCTTKRIPGGSILIALTLLLAFMLTATGWSAELGYSIVTKNLKQKPDKATEIDLKFPHMTGYATPGVQQKFNELIKYYLDGRIAGFMKDRKEFGNEENKNYGLWYNYRVTYKSPTLISLIMEGSNFLGGAHPTPEFYTMLFSLKENRVMGLPDLFKNNAKYMDFISKYAANEIKKKDVSDDEWIKKGTDPKGKGNYDFFYLTGDSLVIFFPTYQVACYAAGPQEVKIPYSKLKDMINPQGPLGWTLK